VTGPTPPTAPTPLTAPTQADWDKAVAVLRHCPEAVLAGHLNPDADALGSMLALAQVLHRRGCRVRPSFSEPFDVPASLAGLPGVELLVRPEEVPPAPALLVTLDTGSPDRLGTLAGLVDTAAEVLVVDHHASNTGFGTVHLVDPAAAATAVLVEQLVHRLGEPLHADVAACLYAGLITDTGAFKFAATTAETHELAARLLRTGIRHDLIARQLLDTHPAGWLGMVGAALSRARLEPAAASGLGLVWTEVRTAELAAAGLAPDQAESVIDLVRTAAEAELAAVCKEIPGGGWTVSLRSKGRVDVSAAAVSLGGGGHRFAAGFTSAGDLDATMAAIRTAVDAAPRLPG
jgi:bifunctional oligoribonuclease and PAP phosphatase NrnA